MRVLYVLPAEGFGGAERQGLVHICGLARRGFTVIPVVGPGQVICRALEAEGLRDYVYLRNILHEHSRPISTLRRTVRKLRALQAWLALQGQLRRLIRRHQIDIVVANRPFAWATVSGAARRLGRPLLWRGGSRITERQHVLGLRLLVRLWRPDLFLCNCEAVRASLGPLLPGPVAILPNGVDTERFHPLQTPALYRALPGLRPGPTIGFAGRPHPEKGLELLAQVLARVRAQVPTVNLLVAGEHGWRDHYARHFARAGLGEVTRFLGHVEQMAPFYRSCDVVLLCSREHSIEGSPNAMLEAMAMARPVVSTRVGGVAETLRDGVHGFLVPDGDAEAMAHRVTQLLIDASLRRRLGRAARSTILRRHGSRAVVGQLARILARVAADHATVATSPAPAGMLGSG